MTYFVYILTNKSNTLYVGVTNNIKRRMQEHVQELVPGFTARYHLHILVYYAQFDRIEEAIAAEKRIKGWTRKKKIVLIKSTNPDFNDLHNSI